MFAASALALLAVKTLPVCGESAEFVAAPSVRRQARRLIDLDDDGNEDIYHITDARTDTPKSTEYEAYFHKVLDEYNCGQGYFGYGCEKRLCSFGMSWTVDSFMLSEPSDELYAPWGQSDQGGMHAYQECSGKGVCDRENGKCRCFEGYHGKGCRYKSCPNDCGEHGICQPAYVINPDYASITTGAAATSQFWDYDRSFRCECDYGYTGMDCSDRVCPVGLDPVNPFAAGCDDGDDSVDQTVDFFGSDQQIIRFPTSMPDDQWFFLEFETHYGGKPFRTHPVHYDSVHLATLAGDIQRALESLPNEAVPSCQTRVLEENDADVAASVLVAFTDNTMAGRQALLTCEAPSTTEGSACESGVQPMIHSLNTAGVDCTTDYYNDETQIYAGYECSARGQCDVTSGKCECHSGFSGLRCENMYSFF